MWNFYTLRRRTAASLVMALAAAGCAGTHPGEITVNSYRGNSIVMSSGVFDTGLAPAEQNKIDTNPADLNLKGAQRVKIFVETSHASALTADALEVKGLDPHQVHVDKDRITAELLESAGNSSVRYGGFVLVDDPKKAELIVTVSFREMTAWGDSISADSNAQSDYHKVQASQKSDKSREGIDMLVSYSVRSPNGQRFWAENILTRMASEKGKIITTGNATFSDKPITIGNTVDGQTASVDEKRLPQMIGGSTDAGLAVALKDLMVDLWDNTPGPTGQRAKHVPGDK